MILASGRLVSAAISLNADQNSASSETDVRWPDMVTERLSFVTGMVACRKQSVGDGLDTLSFAIALVGAHAAVCR
jgi:hypothetical protein